MPDPEALARELAPCNHCHGSGKLLRYPGLMTLALRPSMLNGYGERNGAGEVIECGYCDGAGIILGAVEKLRAALEEAWDEGHTEGYDCADLAGHECPEWNPYRRRDDDG